MNCSHTNVAPVEDDIPPNLWPFVDVLLNETAEEHSNTAPANLPEGPARAKTGMAGTTG